MPKYIFDGEKLKYGSKTIANVRGDKIREGNGSTTICNIRGDKIRDGLGSKTMFNIRGDAIRMELGSKKIAEFENVDDAIKGPGGITKAALWLYFVR